MSIRELMGFSSEKVWQARKEHVVYGVVVLSIQKTE